MREIREIIEADRLASIVNLPKEMRGSDVEIIVLPISAERAKALRSPSPFAPNATTIDAMNEARNGKLKSFDNVKALIEELNADD
jgi:hypothetical protein